MGEKNSKNTKGPAYQQPDHIKPKSKWTKKTTVWTIVIAVIVLGILAIIGSNNGWFKTADMINGKIVMEDYSDIEVSQSDVEVPDSYADYLIQNIISANTTFEDVTEGTVEEGDSIKVSYNGVLTGETEPFFGGTGEDVQVVIGSGSLFSADFEEQLVGHEVGETFEVSTTLPDDYTLEDLQGKDADITVTINSKTITIVPEITDEMASEYAADNLDLDVSTVDELRTAYIEKTYESKLENAIMTAMEEKADVKYYNEANLAALENYNLSSVSYYASQYGMDSTTYVSMFGYDSVQAYAESTSKDALKEIMIIEKVAQDQGITISDDEIDEKLSEYMDLEDFTGTLEEFKEGADPGALYLITQTEVLQPKVMDYLKSIVTIVETPEEEAPEGDEVEEAAEDISEDVEQVSEIAEDVSEDVEEVSEIAEDIADVSETESVILEEVSEIVEEAVEEAESK